MQDHDLAQIVIETVGALVVVLDRDGRIQRWNAACEARDRLRPRTRCSGSRSGTSPLPRSATASQAVFARLLARDFPHRHENHWVAQDGQPPAHRLANTALLDDARRGARSSSRPGSTSPSGRARRRRCGGRRCGSRRSPRRRACSPPGSTTRRRSTPSRGGSPSSSATARSSASSRPTAAGSCRSRSTTRRRSAPRCAGASSSRRRSGRRRG